MKNVIMDRAAFIKTTAATILAGMVYSVCPRFFLPVAAAAVVQKAYTMNTGNTTVYSDEALTQKYGTIFDTDELTIEKIGANATLVTYPIKNGTKTGYISTPALFTSTSGSRVNASKKMTTYVRPGGKKYGSVSVGDSILILGTSGGYTQIRYPLDNGGYKFAFILTSDLGDSSSSKGGSVEDDVRARMDMIMDGSLSKDKNTVMKKGKTFTGTKASEQCKGYAKNCMALLFGVSLNSTKDKPNNHLINDTAGLSLVGSVVGMSKNDLDRSVNEISSLFGKAKAGDFVQMRRQHTGSHSAIVYKVTAGGVTFLEANTDGNNTVMLNDHTWSDLVEKNEKMSLYTASDYRLK